MLEGDAYSRSHQHCGNVTLERIPAMPAPHSTSAPEPNDDDSQESLPLTKDPFLRWSVLVLIILTIIAIVTNLP